jgi:hypothetical protein
MADGSEGSTPREIRIVGSSSESVLVEAVDGVEGVEAVVLVGEGFLGRDLNHHFGVLSTSDMFLREFLLDWITSKSAMERLPLAILDLTSSFAGRDSPNRVNRNDQKYDVRGRGSSKKRLVR